MRALQRRVYFLMLCLTFVLLIYLFGLSSEGQYSNSYKGNLHFVNERLSESNPTWGFNRQTQQTDNRVTSVPVLILAYYRSGSTFTGSLLRQAEGSFYRFEPLHAFNNLIKTGTAPRYFDGTTRQLYTESDKEDLLIDMVRPFLDCHFTNVPVQLITNGFGQWTDQAKTVNECVKRKETNCLVEYTEACRKASVRIVKAIRVRMSRVPELLKVIPNLKVIHLLRDPRGHFLSANRFSDGRPSNSTAAGICDDVWGDIKERLKQEKIFPNTFLQVIYEDIAQKPIVTAQEIYKFLGLELTGNVKKWIQSSTNGEKDTDILGTTKVNSTKTAYKWTQIIPWEYVQYFEDNCPELVRWGRFPVFRAEEEVRNFSIPIRSRYVNEQP